MTLKYHYVVWIMGIYHCRNCTCIFDLELTVGSWSHVRNSGGETANGFAGKRWVQTSTAICAPRENFAQISTAATTTTAVAAEVAATTGAHVDHGLEHLGGDDDGLSLAPAAVDDLLLRDGHHLRGHLHAEVTSVEGNAQAYT